MHPSVRELLQQVGQSKMPAVAYDTAWVARLGEIAPDLSQRALDWLCEHQLPDGSWGAAQPYHYHDRLVSTLAAMIALAQHGRRARDRAQIERGLLALEAITSSATQRLSAANSTTVGFELIVPTLVAEAERLGLIKQQGERILGRLAQQRKVKLELLNGRKINRYITAAFSAEMAGEDNQHMLDIENLQEENGSVGCSPSATAFFAAQVKRGDERALGYLRGMPGDDGGIPDVASFDIFEIAWTLWNLSMSLWRPSLQEEQEIQRHIGSLSRSWDKHGGAGFSSEYSVNDGDETALVFDVLLRHGITKESNSVLAYEEKKWFKCFDLENSPSLSANVHILGALRQAGFKRGSPVVGKILGFLQWARFIHGYWMDKWHISPYYPTAHAVIACTGFAEDLVRPAVEWILQTQNPDGSWGYQFPTAEETAYSLQALAIWQRHGGHVPRAAIERAAAWLQEHAEPPYPPLWIGKGLYTPELVVRSAVLSALLLAEKG